MKGDSKNPTAESKSLIKKRATPGDTPTSPNKRPKHSSQEDTPPDQPTPKPSLLFSPLSAISTPRKSGTQISSITIKYELDGAGNIHFTISRGRPKTSLKGSKQGDHVTAYITFLRMISETIKLEDVSAAQESLIGLFKALFPDRSDAFQKDFEEKFSYQSPISRHERKKQTSRISRLNNVGEKLASLSSSELLMEAISAIINREDGAPKLKEEAKQLKAIFEDAQKTAEVDVPTVKKSMVRSESAYIAEYAVFLGERIIESLNQEQDMCFSRIGEQDSAEGSRVKNAINALLALNYFYQLEEATEEEKESIRKKLYSDFKENNSSIRSGFKEIFNKTRAIDKEKCDKTISDLKIKIKDGDFWKTVGNFINNLFDFSFEIHGATPNIEQTLFSVCARHLVIIFNTFKHFPNDKKDKIIDGFLECVLEQQRWREFEKDGENLDIKALKAGIEIYMDKESGSMKIVDEELELFGEQKMPQERSVSSLQKRVNNSLNK